jgi:hypothetical protein
MGKLGDCAETDVVPKIAKRAIGKKSDRPFLKSIFIAPQPTYLIKSLLFVDISTSQKLLQLKTKPQSVLSLLSEFYYPKKQLQNPILSPFPPHRQSIHPPAQQQSQSLIPPVLAPPLLKGGEEILN